MPKEDGSRDRATKRMRWMARIWSLTLMACALLMAIGYLWSWVTTGVADPHAVEDVHPAEALPPILMFLSILGLGIAWRRERLGATIVIVFQVATFLLLLVQSPLTYHRPNSAIPYVLSLIVAIPGVLFLVCGRRSTRGKSV
jgi:hypothetical protein